MPKDDSCPFAKGEAAPQFPFTRNQQFELPKEYAIARERCPVAPVKLWNGQQAWLLTRYKEYCEVLLDDRFSGEFAREDFPTVTEARKAIDKLERAFVGMDNPRHDHYRRMFESNLGYGAQACWRGPRLFDGEETKAMVQAQVRWYLQHRMILESDVIHSSSRRPDGQDLDWVLHSSSRCDPPGMLVAYNPTPAARKRIVPLNLYYTGLKERTIATNQDGEVYDLVVDPRGHTAVEVDVPAGGMAWFTFR